MSRKSIKNGLAKVDHLWARSSARPVRSRALGRLPGPVGERLAHLTGLFLDETFEVDKIELDGEGREAGTLRTVPTR